MADFKIKDKQEIKDDLLRTIKKGLINRGIENPNVGKGTLFDLIADGFSDFGALVYDGISASANACLPDSALGDDLIRLARNKGLTLSPAGPSSGLISFTASIDTPIGFISGLQLIDNNGLIYTVTVGGSFDSTQYINISSVDTGTQTNLEKGATLRWTNPPPFVDSIATVVGLTPDSTEGLTGGVDAETIEGLRTRLLALEAGPPNAGENYTSVNSFAEKASSAVQKAFSYPGVYGPGTAHVAVVRAPTATSKTRDIDSLIMSTQVIPNVLGEMAEFTDISVTTVNNIECNISVGLLLPTAKTAIPAGPGGGWYDARPFPLTPLSGFSSVTVISSNEMTVNSYYPPVIGGRVCYVSPLNWKIYHSKIVTVHFDMFNNYTITLDNGFFYDDATGEAIRNGDWIFPDAVNMDTYIAALLKAFASLGPGQKTDFAGLLPRAYRKPLVNITFPCDISGRFIKTFTQNVGDEVYDSAIIYSSPSECPLNENYQEPPNILVPNKIAFYQSA
jgi:uncharacterized phage protein gp47/JayE